ncbi:HXXEE domain-containing protein [Gammaproteobacteria bacterium]|nr:HXXEE domain-containing protein [Gammaproteobacteria bacterium]MDC0405700.1 HXXEE domain-containing protein [Gammaproteobacteria bacterium]MDC0420905.1 HXXEE domain-containing protein [Gammaproteobacteria bacterium]MDC1149626.1 HXXEE domain-containing protein [Gammaproteobacteria bacterium]MDC3244672.1 HXXEE domain-containing protein [Gammaproteobacteria bacterium]
MNKFKNLIVLGPLIYAIHHFEEHVIFNFREWRLSYFSDNNSITTEAILIILISQLLIFIFLHLIKNNRGSAHIVLFFLMTTQVINAFFHIFFSFYFNDFSPGAITAVLLYLPVNYFIIKAAFRDGYIKSYVELLILFLSGIATFTLFEMIGPKVLGYALILMPVYYIIINKLENRNESVI